MIGRLLCKWGIHKWIPLTPKEIHDEFRANGGVRLVLATCSRCGIRK